LSTQAQTKDIFMAHLYSVFQMSIIGEMTTQMRNQMDRQMKETVTKMKDIKVMFEYFHFRSPYTLCELCTLRPL
jgi:hypothetical protein